MVLHKCHRCHKEFNTTQHYTRHLKRKHPCKVLEINQKNPIVNGTKKVLKCNQNVTNKEEIKKVSVYQCEACKRTFKHRQNKYAHVKTCKKVLEKNKTQKIKELNQKLKDIKLRKNIVIVNKLDTC